MLSDFVGLSPAAVLNAWTSSWGLGGDILPKDPHRRRLLPRPRQCSGLPGLGLGRRHPHPHTHRRSLEWPPSSDDHASSL